MVSPNFEPIPIVKEPAQALEVEPTLGTIQALLEKNLKWAQIIYEQNRKINSKLLWSAIAGWMRFFLILIPLALGIIFLPPLFKGIINQYSGLLNYSSSANQNAATPTADDILKILPLNSAQREQLKAILK